MNDRPLILITNDDGVEAKGIKSSPSASGTWGTLWFSLPTAPFGNGKRDHFARADQVYIGKERKKD